MVSALNGCIKNASNDNQKVAKRPGAAQQPSTSKKRKAEDDTPDEENKENVERPSTPQRHLESELANLPGYERTPGRDGPIKQDNCRCQPDIQPFRGPKGQKVRKTAWEKNEEYRQFAREHEGHPFHELYVCFDKGPNGSPTYDKSGFQLDYDKVADWMKPRPYNRARIMKSSDRAVEKADSDRRQMAEIFFEKGEAPADEPWRDIWSVHAWKDRVSKDLDVPWHKIEVEHFKEWETKGFKKASKGEYENTSELERKRMSRLMSGASLRK